ncbi:MAG: ethanolamine ammonia-lyase [Oscillospiraceae bacterium]|nr:ethanolamine ammonia-lyase [Oscillospiraceae bacterium]
MQEALLSVGIDIGTTTTQLVISRLTLENRANPFSVPQISIAQREVLYRSGIHFTPLRSDTAIHAEGVREIVEEEYRRSGFQKGQIDTGAVIITGETARKENAKEVLNALSAYAGDFVVATAGPDLESILAARGAGADRCAREKHAAVLHFDIGGGTSNLAYFTPEGELAATGCLDVGGRLIKIADRQITYVSKALHRLADAGGPPPPGLGQTASPDLLSPVIDALVQALEQAAGLRPGRDRLDALITAGTKWTPPPGPLICSFSGGVADCMGAAPADPFLYGDLGVLLGQAIRAGFQGVDTRLGDETIRATVVGAGSHATDLSGATVFYRGISFPLKNLPVLKLTQAEEAGDAAQLAGAISSKLCWFAGGDGLTQLALALRGIHNPTYHRVQEVAQGVRQGLQPLLEAGFFPVLVLESDMAKVLGQALAPQIPGPLLCLDGIHLDSGDYLDVGAPVANGAVVPVVMKTLVFHS